MEVGWQLPCQDLGYGCLNLLMAALVAADLGLEAMQCMPTLSIMRERAKPLLEAECWSKRAATGMSCMCCSA